MIILRSAILLLVLLAAVFCAVQSYLMVVDALNVGSRKDRVMSAVGGSTMFLLTVGLWFLFVYLVQYDPFA